MQSLHANTEAELQEILTQFGKEHLFRGQTRAYNDTQGNPLINSSFIRQGCAPPLMLKWAFFVRELLRRGGFDITRSDALYIEQGLLQHYGWRSFFVDLSSSTAVAAWFASHSFSSNSYMELCETQGEEAIMLMGKHATYEAGDGDGNLYVFSKELLKSHGHQLIHLEAELTTDCRTRFEVQCAWLAGIFREQVRLDPATIVAHITAPSPVFAEVASAAGFVTTDDVFPGPDNDKILENLLNLPRVELEMPKRMFRTFVRSLDIPEYQVSSVKHLPLSTVLIKPFWVSDAVANAPDELWLRVQEGCFHGAGETNRPMPRLAAYLREKKITNIEVRGIVCYPAVSDSQTYEKGISIRRNEHGHFAIGSITVDYAGDQVTGIGVAHGYAYELDGNRLVRRLSADDCPCGDPERHHIHLRTLAIVDEVLSRGRVKRNGNIVTAQM